MTDGKTAGNMAMKHLAKECGHTHIGVLATQLQYPHACFSQRYKGAVEYAAKHPDIKLSMVEIPELELHSQSSYELTEELMKKDPQITAVFATCDMLAFGVYNYAAKNNLRIPEDLSVLGFGDQLFTALMNPPLSTFSESAEDIGKYLIKLVLEVLKNPNKSVQNTFVSPRMILRGSVAECGRKGRV
jgi:DNA-binding LacI/PurR family transcriptional regulator